MLGVGQNSRGPKLNPRPPAHEDREPTKETQKGHQGWGLRRNQARGFQQPVKAQQGGGLGGAKATGDLPDRSPGSRGWGCLRRTEASSQTASTNKPSLRSQWLVGTGRHEWRKLRRESVAEGCADLRFLESLLPGSVKDFAGRKRGGCQGGGGLHGDPSLWTGRVRSGEGRWHGTRYPNPGTWAPSIPAM